MAQNILTSAHLKIKGNGKQQMLSDGEGLNLRISPTGSRSWIFIYVSSGKQHRMSLGPAPEITLNGARERAREIRKLIAEGIDPVGERKKQEIEKKIEKHRNIIPETVIELLSEWKRIDLSRLRKDGGVMVEKILNKHALPYIGHLKMHEVRRAHIVALLDEMKMAKIIRQSNITLSLLRQMWGFAILREWTDNDPTARIPKLSESERERERTLSNSEITELAKKIPAAGMQETSSLAIWIQLSITCRIGELMKSEWKNIDLEERTLFFPREIRKGSLRKPPKDHYVYLSDFTIGKLARLKQLTGHTDFLFPATNKKDSGHVCEKSVSKQIADRQRGANGMSKRRCDTTLCLSGGNWRPHDLRRTSSTLMGELGFPDEVVRKCLSHVNPNKIDRIYHRHGYDKEMMRAWEAVGKRLSELTDI